MDTYLLSADNPESIQKAIETLQAGEVVAFPTDTVYGLGVDPFNISAIIKLFETKGREFNKAIAILVGNLDQIDQITDQLSETAKKLIAQFWPGGLTVIVSKKKNVPDLLSANQTIGIRMPDHPIALKILREFGPLATTSANLSGKQNTISAYEVQSQLAGRVKIILDGGTCPGGIPSTVVNCVNEESNVLRQGVITEKQIREVLKP